MDDARDGTRWLTYGELAAARGISKASATRLAFRKHWPRRTGNDGQARVAVPLDARAPPHDTTHDSHPVTIHDDTHDARDGVTPGNSDAETLARERQRADQAEARAEQTEAQGAVDREAAAAREAELRAVAERQGQELTAALLRATIAESEARAGREVAKAREAGLREALAEARRPAWRRWMGWP